MFNKCQNNLMYLSIYFTFRFDYKIKEEWVKTIFKIEHVVSKYEFSKGNNIINNQYYCERSLILSIGNSVCVCVCVCTGIVHVREKRKR